MSNRRFFAICSFMLLLSLACSSCSTAKDTISSDVQSTPPTTASDSTTLMDDSEPISTASFVKAGNGPLVSLDSGIYEAQIVYENSCSIFYTDPIQQKRIYLCGAPNCTHDKEKFNSQMQQLFAYIFVHFITPQQSRQHSLFCWQPVITPILLHRL